MFGKKDFNQQKGRACFEYAVSYSVVSALVVAAGLGPFLIVKASQDREKLPETIDSNSSIIFTSLEDCYRKTEDSLSCQKSFKSAKSKGFKFTYAHEDLCKERHLHCEEYAVGNYIAGKVRINGGTYYRAPIVAWQAAQGDLENAVPLYSTSSKYSAVREDGKTFNLK